MKQPNPQGSTLSLKQFVSFINCLWTISDSTAMHCTCFGRYTWYNIRYGRTLCAVMWSCVLWYGVCDMVWCVMVGHGLSWCGMVWSDMVWCFNSMGWCGIVWCDMVCYVMVWGGLVCYGVMWYVLVCYGMAWFIMVWYGVMWHGLVWYCVVWYGMV